MSDAPDDDDADGDDDTTPSQDLAEAISVYAEKFGEADIGVIGIPADKVSAAAEAIWTRVFQEVPFESDEAFRAAAGLEPMDDDEDTLI